MPDRAAALLSQIEQRKADMLSEIEAWSRARLTYQPAATEWSVLQIFDHLLRTETAILAAARQGLTHPHRIGFSDRARTRFLQGVFRSDRKVKVPGRASVILPGTDLDFPSLAQRWRESSVKLRRFAQSVPSGRVGLFKHPVGGWMGFDEILDFFSVHLLHHGYQIARLRESSRHLTSEQT